MPSDSGLRTQFIQTPSIRHKSNQNAQRYNRRADAKPREGGTGAGDAFGELFYKKFPKPLKKFCTDIIISTGSGYANKL